MPKGPNEQKLDEALTGTSFVDIHVSETEWNEGSKRLTDVAKALREAAPDMETGFGGETGQSAREAFTNVAAKADERSTQMGSAKEALFAAKMAMVKAQGVRNSMGDMPTQPTAPTPQPGMQDADQIRQERAYSNRMAGYNSALADRESKAEAAVREMNQVYTESTEAMKKVHGEPDRRPGGSSGSGGSSGGGSTPPSGSPPPSGTPPTGTPPGGSPPPGGTPPGGTPPAALHRAARLREAPHHRLRHRCSPRPAHPRAGRRFRRQVERRVRSARSHPAVRPAVASVRRRREAWPVRSAVD